MVLKWLLTGAKVSVCGADQAKKLNLLNKMTKTKVKIKPYKGKVIPAIGESLPVLWYIIKEKREPVLSGWKAKQLGIIQFQPMPEAFMPIRIKLENKQDMQSILCRYPQNFKGIGKLRGYSVKSHVDPQVKPVAEPLKRIPYHLKDRVEEAVSEMLASDVIEGHPSGEPAP